MQLLRCAKNSHPIGRDFFFVLYCIMQVELLSLFLIKENSIFFINLLSFFNDNSKLFQMVIIIFGFFIIQILYILFFYYNNRNITSTSTNSKPIMFRFMELQPYFLFGILAQINMNGLINGPTSVKLFASFNLLFMALIVMVLKYINVSYRFLEPNYIRRKQASFIPVILNLVIVFTINFYQSAFYAAALLIIKAIFVGYGNIDSFQNSQIKKCEWLFPLISLQLGFMVIVKQYIQTFYFENIIILVTVILLTVWVSFQLSDQLYLRNYKRIVLGLPLITKMGEQNASQMSKQQSKIDEQQLVSLLTQLRIIVNVYDAKLNYRPENVNDLQNCTNYDDWWMICNRFLLNHKVCCSNVQCVCHQLKPRLKTNTQKENQLMFNIISGLIQFIKNHSTFNKKFQIVQNYFLIQIDKKPLKTYFQIIKLSQTQLNTEEKLQVQSLIHEARDGFKQFFLKQKVKNTELDIQPLFQFQDHLKDMRLRLNNMAVQYRHFYEIFANNFIQMQLIKQKTKKITQYKKLFNQQIDFCLKQFDKSIQLMTFCIVYFKFFDQYTNKLQKVQQKAEQLIQGNRISIKEINKVKIDIFDSYYGAAKMDLVFHTGKIMKITKNMCDFLGYSYHQLINEKVNKIMPLMFAKNHDKFLRNFVQKGQITIMKLKQKVIFAKKNNKFIVPLNLRLKVDYSSSQGMYGVALANLIQTKSEFILMNNYGKVQDITQGIYEKIFSQAYGKENRKVKRLCVGKFILSFNEVLKNINKTKGNIIEGYILTSDEEQIMANYFQFPEFKKVYKGKSENQGQSTSRSKSSISQSYSGTDLSRTIDLSEDMAQYNVDLKETLRVSLKNFDYRKVKGFRISYRCQELVTSEFKCKFLQILSIGDQITGEYLKPILKQQIIDLVDVIGFQERQIDDFKIFRQQKDFVSKSQTSLSQQKNNNQSQGQVQLFSQQSIGKISKIKDNKSDTGSVLSLNQKSRKKQSLISSFQQRTPISPNLQHSITLLIFALALILLVICIFSIQLKGNYENIQEDNLILTNYRVDFLLLFGIQQLNLMYKLYAIQPPKFLSEKREIFVNRMKQDLIKSTTWIGISQEGYKIIMPFKYDDVSFEDNKPLLTRMIQIYTIFVADQSHAHYLTDNYISISSYLLGLTQNEEKLISNASKQYLSQIHIIISFYSFILFLVIVVGIWYRRIGMKKQDTVIDFLVFFQSNEAKKKQLFYEKFFQINKDSQEINIDQTQNIDFKQNDIKKYKTKNILKIVRNEKSGITLKIIAFVLFVLFACFFVIFYSEYFFASLENKFQIYLSLKNSAFLVQLIPSRILVLYFSNINRMLKQEKLYNYTESFYKITHDRMFQLPIGLSKKQFYGSDMEKILSDHFSREICSMIDCPSNPKDAFLIRDQQVYYLATRFANSFSYLRKIINTLPEMDNPREEVLRWMDQNHILEVIETSEYLLDLMKRSERVITDLFNQQINEIGTLLFALSVTLIPTLIIILLYLRKKFINFVGQRVECTQQVFSHISWKMLSQNNQALNYFESRVKNLNKN